jgi:hypothetical protein
MLRADRLIEAVRGRKKSVMYLGSALALAGAGGASAATMGGAPAARPVAPVITKTSAAAPSQPTTRPAAVARRQGSTRPDVSSRPTPRTTPGRAGAERPAARGPHASTHPAAAHGDSRHAPTHGDPRHPATHVTHNLAAHASTHPAAAHGDSRHPATHGAPRHPARHVTHDPASRHAEHATIHAATQTAARAATHVDQAHASRPAAAHPAARIVTWGQVSAKLNQETNPAAARHDETPPADKLMPVATSGPQSWMPINPAQYANATTIVRQALARRMGVRSAVVAVATAMQESRLLNIDYGTSDSLGLFQQQPDCGWGTAAQVLNPSYASDAFLNALQRYQAGNPAWSTQPLYQAAQGVQNSGFPFAYAQWESQAAHLVQSIVMRMA